MKTLAAQAEANRHLDAVEAVWLIEADFDMFQLASVARYWASRDFTLSGDAFEGILAEEGLDLGAQSVEARGGISSVSGGSISLRNEEEASAIADQYVLLNDQIAVSLVFVDGAQVAADAIELARYIVETHRTEGGEWTLTLKDGSRRLLRKFPNKLLEPVFYPNAYSWGKVLPVAFGNLNIGPTDGTGAPVSLAPVAVTDRFALQGTSGLYNKTFGALFQWYGQAGAFAEVMTISQSGATVTFANPSRRLVLRPVREKTSNDRTTWAHSADGDYSTSVSVGSGQNLDVFFSGAPKLGRLTALAVVIRATGTYTYTVKDDTTTLASGASVTGDQTIALVAANYTEWDLALLNVEIDGISSAAIKEIELRIDFNDFLAFQESEPALFQKVVGWQDQAANYYDGAVITGAGTALRNPVHILQAVLRGKGLNELGTARIVNGWSAAATSREDWVFDFTLRESLDEGWLSSFCFLAGLHLFPEQGGWSVAALDKTRAPQHFFHGDYHLPVQGGDGPLSAWDYDLHIEPLDISSVLNEVALRYAPHSGTGEMKKARIASGQYRLSGTCTLTAAGLLTTADANFSTVIAGEIVFIFGDREYRVLQIPTSTTLTVEAVDGGTPTASTSAQAFWLGPNLDGRALVSQLAYKTVNALGTRQEIFTDDGGFKVPLLYDDDTAELLLDNLMEWFSQPRDRVQIAVGWSAVDVQLGDVVYFEHERLRQSQRPPTLNTLVGAHNAATTTLTLDEAGYGRQGDYFYLWSDATNRPEAMRIEAVNLGANTWTVTRGMLSTQAQSFAGGEKVRRLQAKWMVTGLRPMLPTDPLVKLTLEQMPKSYFPVGRAVEDGYPDYADATDLQRIQSGWAAYPNGLVNPLDTQSDISYAG